MHVSLRSQMIAGTAALGAAAIALSPVAQPDLLPSMQRVSSAVQLSALSLSNPITAIAGVVDYVAQDIFDQSFISDNVVWPEFFYTNIGTEQNPDLLFYTPINFGIIPNLVNQFSFGTIQAVVNNLSGYTYAGYSAVSALGTGVASAVFNTPVALINAAQYLAAGDTAAAIAELQTQILGPLQQGFTTAFNAVGYILDNVIRNVQTLVTITTPTLISGLLNDWAIGGATYVVQSAISTVTAIVSSLTSLDFAGAWNSAVDGFLGVNGTLGQLESLTLGVGIFGGDEEPVIEVPSIRSVLNSVATRTGDFADYGIGGILNDAFSITAPTAAAVASTPAGPASRAAAPAAEAAEVQTPVAESADVAASNQSAVAADAAPSVTRPVAGSEAGAVAGSEAGSVAGSEAGAAAVETAATENAAAAAPSSSAAAPKAAKQGVSRKAAKAAADK